MEDADDLRDKSAYGGCYINTCQQSDDGDFQLEADVGEDEWVSIAHIGHNHFHNEVEMGLSVDSFRSSSLPRQRRLASILLDW